MATCDICKKEHNDSIIRLSITDDEKKICPTCYLLSTPSYNQLQSIASDGLTKSHPAPLNLYLYNKLCQNYAIPTVRSSPSVPTKKKASSRSSKDYSDSYTDLTELAPKKFYGREKDLSDVFNILSRFDKRNPLIIGQSGTGKTAMVHHMAHLLEKGNCPSCLKGKRIIELNLSRVMAGTKYRGDLEEKIHNIFKSIKDENTIVFIDDIHNLSTKGSSAEDSSDFAYIVKPYLMDGSIQIIGTTTVDNYRKTIEADNMLSRQFQTVFLEEQSVSEVISLIKDISPEMESYHDIEIPNETIESCVKLADQYIKYRCFPDKAIDLLDMACSRKKNSTNSQPSSKISIDEFMKSKDISDAINSLPSNSDLINILIGKSKDIETLANCSRYLQDRYEEEFGGVSECSTYLSFDDLADTVEFWTKIPVKAMSANLKKQLKALSPTIKEAVVGQDEAVDAVVASICRRKLGITKSKRPASFIFVGETGVGKTELAKALSKSLFGQESKLIRFDMSEYMESHSVSKLIGAPPGYVGFSEAGQLTEALRRHPFSVVLFDEIEKAHPDVSNILLQLLDDGRITDSKGQLIDASNAIVILTSNAGANLPKGLGFGRGGIKDEETFKKGLMSAFRPEFLGRVDSIISFNSLTDDNYQEIARHYIDRIVSSLEESSIELTYSDDLVCTLCKKSDTDKYHAREIARSVTKYVEDAIASAILDSDEEIEVIRLTSDADDEIRVLINNEAYALA